MKRSFNEIYQEIYYKTNEELKKCKEKRNKSLLLLFVFGFAMMYSILKTPINVEELLLYLYCCIFMIIMFFYFVIVIQISLEKILKIEVRVEILFSLIFLFFVVWGTINVIQYEDKAVLIEFISPLLQFFFIIATVINFCLVILDNAVIKHIFKEEVMKNLVEAYSNKLTFRYKPGTTYAIYRKSKFDESVNKVLSEDLIKGNILENTPFEMSEVTAFITEVKNDWQKYDKIKFKGLFGVAWGEGNIVCPEILVQPNKIANRFLENRIEVESVEFENHYDVFSEDKIVALKLITPEVIEEINDFTRKTGYEIEIKVINEKTFFRIHCGEMFEKIDESNMLEYSNLYRYYCMIDGPIKIMEKIVDNINYSKETVYM